MSVIFIEGPDYNGKKELYLSVADELRKDQAMKKQHPICFHEVITDMKQWPNEPYYINDDLLRIQMILDMGARNQDIDFVICSGPLQLLNMAMEFNDLDSAKRISNLFSCEHYQNVSVISVTSDQEDIATRTAYRQTSSRYLQIMSDTDKGNKYRLFMHKYNCASHKLFLNDVLSLINN